MPTANGAIHIVRGVSTGPNFVTIFVTDEKHGQKTTLRILQKGLYATPTGPTAALLQPIAPPTRLRAAARRGIHSKVATRA